MVKTTHPDENVGLYLTRTGIVGVNTPARLMFPGGLPDLARSVETADLAKGWRARQKSFVVRSCAEMVTSLIISELARGMADVVYEVEVLFIIFHECALC